MRKHNVKITKDQNDMFTGDSVDQTQINAAKEILLNAGYKIIKINIVTSVKTVKDLKDYFYNRLYKKYPKLLSNRVSSIQTDMRFASLFLESRLNPGNLGKEAALQECVDIIDIIFDYEEEFMFKYPIKDITVLGQGKLSWITHKAIEILNREKYKKMEIESEKTFREMEDSIEVDLIDKQNKMNKILARMEESGGKEKKP